MSIYLPKEIGLRLGLAVGAVAAVVLAASTSGRATSDRALNAMSQAQTTLNLILETADKQQYVLGEPVYLTLRLRNEGQTPALVMNLLRPEDGLVKVRVVGPDGRQVGYVPLGTADTDVGPDTLPPGAEFAAVFPVFFGASGWTFQQPGDYEAVAHYEQGDPERGMVSLQSNPVAVRVTDDEAGAFLLSRDEAGDEIGKFLVWGSGDHLRVGIAQLQNMLDRFPASTVGAYANFALGKSLATSFMDYSVGRVRPPDCRTAVERLSAVEAGTLPAYLRIQLELAMAACRIRMQQPDRARASLERAKGLIDGRAEFLAFNEQVARLENALAGAR